ncbi:PREDICTED: disease resistance protein RPM1-like [Prunus mume]|uniref:Disease resistance protein RPM1-like n=1 Tax=Prunus mume TaxID=102107 RepID=A0ABM0NKX6_PRUMU|nr:PREDICTED: disease resistance protein RPM1-like [Prunus mume]
MLSKFDPKGKREGPDHHEDPKVQLRLLLEQKRFVLVLDNVWSNQDLECNVNAIPNGLLRSKVIITSRTFYVASGRAKSHAHIYDLSNLLSKEDTRSLFYKKAFHDDREGKCPPELKEFARCPLEDFPNSVVGLTLLRYLCLRETNVRTVPKSIKNLGFLETLDLKQTKVTKSPAQIYALHNLRHLLVYRYNVPNYVTFGAARGVKVYVGNIVVLCCIQKLSLITVKNNRKIMSDLGKLKGLRKLGLTDLERKDGRDLSTNEEEFLDLDHKEFPPHFLQRPYLKGRLERLPKWIFQLHSVAKIGLKWLKLDANESPFEALKALPNLMDLDLVRYYTREKLEFKKDTFKELKILHIEQFDQLNMMVVQNGSMPKLKKLTMTRCQNLELLPLGIEGLRSLDELLLYDMHNLFIARLQRGSEDLQAVEHIRVIHSFYLGSKQCFTGFQNLS